MNVYELVAELLDAGKLRVRGALNVDGALEVKGDVALPNGVIGTSELAANAVSAVIGNALVNSNYRVPSAGTWNESDVTSTATFTGAPVRIEWGAQVYGTGAATDIVLSIGRDGVFTWAHVGRWVSPFANSFTTLSGVIYDNAPTVGSHRIGLMVFASQTGAGFWTGGNCSLIITEQRR